MSDLPTSLPMVTIPGVRATSRALYGALGALLGPLLAQSLFGYHVEPLAWGLTMGAGLLSGIALGGVTVREGGALRQVARVLVRALLVGAVAGVVGGNAWVALHEMRPTNLMVAGTLFGGYFGALTGLALGGVFALWALVARNALARPSTLAAMRLSMHAGMVLSVAGAFALAAYRIDEMRALGVACWASGAIFVMAALARTARLGRLLRAVDEGAVQVQERPVESNLPVLAWAPTVDGVLTRPSTATSEPSPFRAQSPVESIALVPRDMTAVRRELKRSVGVGFVVLGLLAAASGVSMFRLATCCQGTQAGAPCSGCAH